MLIIYLNLIRASRLPWTIQPSDGWQFFILFCLLFYWFYCLFACCPWCILLCSCLFLFLCIFFPLAGKKKQKFQSLASNLGIPPLAGKLDTVLYFSWLAKKIEIFSCWEWRAGIFFPGSLIINSNNRVNIHERSYWS